MAEWLEAVAAGVTCRGFHCCRWLRGRWKISLCIRKGSQCEADRQSVTMASKQHRTSILVGVLLYVGAPLKATVDPEIDSGSRRSVSVFRLLTFQFLSHIFMQFYPRIIKVERDLFIFCLLDFTKIFSAAPPSASPGHVTRLLHCIYTNHLSLFACVCVPA